MKKIRLIITVFLAMMTQFSMTANAKKYEKAILAGGCFWGMEELFRSFNGVVETNVGYTGDKGVKPSYAIISLGITNYAEAVEITFDPEKTTYEKILKFFFQIHDPTTLNRQKNDVGRQYRSEIFYLNDEQKRVAEDVIRQANKSGVYDSEVVTRISKAGEFYQAEEYHQDYLQKNPYGYTCHHARAEWKF